MTNLGSQRASIPRLQGATRPIRRRALPCPSKTKDDIAIDPDHLSAPSWSHSLRSFLTPLSTTYHLHVHTLARSSQGVGENELNNASSKIFSLCSCAKMIWFVGPGTFHRIRMAPPHTFNMSSSETSFIGPTPGSLVEYSGALAG